MYDTSGRRRIHRNRCRSEKMEKKQYIVIGEAPESDSEEEVNVPATESFHKRSTDSSNPQGIIIAGEAPESDDEDKVSVCSISSAASISSIASFSTNLKRNTVPEKTKKQENVKYSSLLHRKLRERNISLHRNVIEFVHYNVGIAARDLCAANQQLLKSQLQLQEVALSLHTLHANLSQLQNKLSSATSTTFLSRINVTTQIQQ